MKSLPLPPPSYAIAGGFDDIGDLEDNARHWNLNFRQIDRGPFRAELLQFGHAGIHMGEARFSRALVQEGVAPTGLRTIAVPARSEMRLVWRGKDVGRDSLMVFPQGGELSSVSDSDFHVFTCSFPEEILDDIAVSMGARNWLRQSEGGEAMRCSPNIMKRVRNSLRQLGAIVRSDQRSLRDERFEQLITHDLPVQLLRAVASSDGPCMSANSARHEETLKRAEAFICDHAQEEIVADQISTAAGVSQRTLEFLFKERFGVTPKAFLRMHRLNQVRRELGDSAWDAGLICEIANRWGFWHMGQFAADYRRQFGELPSDTRRRTADTATVE